MVKKTRTNISNRFSYTILSLIFIVFLGVGVYALTAGVAPSVGHTLSTVSAPSGCASNTLLKWTGTDWACIPSPISCTGYNQVLQWTGSIWRCYTVTVESGGTGYECYWTGWTPRSSSYCYYDLSSCDTLYVDAEAEGELNYQPLALYPCPTSCYSPYEEQTLIITEEYCSYGTITQTRPVMRCPYPQPYEYGGTCPPFLALP